MLIFQRALPELTIKRKLPSGMNCIRINTNTVKDMLLTVFGDYSASDSSRMSRTSSILQNSVLAVQ